VPGIRRGRPHRSHQKGPAMAKGQKKSNREVRKPKAEKPKKNASNPTLKPSVTQIFDPKK
jgi:hypothetical protein